MLTTPPVACPHAAHIRDGRNLPERKESTMTTEEWVAANLGTSPPLTPAQISTLRAVFRPGLQLHPDDQLRRRSPANPARARPKTDTGAKLARYGRHLAEP
jgi:hypothetical protein